MTQTLSTLHRPLCLWVVLVLTTIALSVATPSTVSAAGLFRKKEPAKTARPFLPPSSQMNDYLPEDAPADRATSGKGTASGQIQRGNVSNSEGEVVSLTSINGTSKIKGLNSGVTLRPKVERLDGGPSLLGTPPATDAAETLKLAQQQVEQRDLGFLWNATVERNQVMRFSLEKLALPEDLQAGHSSRFLRKTLSVLLSGAAIGATMMSGGGGYQDMSILAASNAMDNMLRGKQEPVSNLSPTEHIQLADLVDQLKVQLVDNYNQLGQGLRLLDSASTRTQLANAAYSESLARKDQPVEQLTQAVTYYQALMQETRLSQRTTLAQLQLARIAGNDAVHEVQLSVMPAASIPDDVASQPDPAVGATAAQPVVSPLPVQGMKGSLPQVLPGKPLPQKKPVAKGGPAPKPAALATAARTPAMVMVAMAPPTTGKSPIVLAPPLVQTKPVAKKVAQKPTYSASDPFQTQVIVDYAP